MSFRDALIGPEDPQALNHKLPVQGSGGSSPSCSPYSQQGPTASKHSIRWKNGGRLIQTSLPLAHVGNGQTQTLLSPRKTLATFKVDALNSSLARVDPTLRKSSAEQCLTGGTSLVLHLLFTIFA